MMPTIIMGVFIALLGTGGYSITFNVASEMRDNFEISTGESFCRNFFQAAENYYSEHGQYPEPLTTFLPKRSKLNRPIFESLDKGMQTIRMREDGKLVCSFSAVRFLSIPKYTYQITSDPYERKRLTYP